MKSELIYPQLFKALKFLFYLIPISLIIGNAALNITAVLIVINLIFISFLDKSFLIKYKNIFFLFLFFFTLLLVNSFFSSDNIKSVISSLGIVRYFFLMIALLYCIEHDNFFLKKFSKFLFFLLLFVAFDTYVQYFFGKDIFGIENSSSHGQRLNGPFGEEYIVGSYLSKLFFFSLMYFFINDKKFIFIFIYLIFILVVIFLTKERMASLMILFTSFIFLMYTSKISFKHRISSLLIFLIIFSSLIYFNKSIKDHLILRSLQQIGLVQNYDEKNNEKRFFKDSQWGAHFITAQQIFLDNPILGSGVKTFRSECGKDKYSVIDSASKNIRCNTHPHNLYLEFLSETGLILFLPFLLFNLFIFFKLTQKIFRCVDCNLTLITLCSFIMLFFPLQTTGSFFSSWNGFFYWFIYALVAYELRSVKS